jgi:ribonuclease BN (tRNA processing enzyme)
MEITLLGISGGYPAPGGATSGYLIRSNEKQILLDCGSGVLSRLFRHASLDKLDAIILTHYHADHFSDISVLKYAMAMNRSNGLELPNLPIYGPATPEVLAASIWDDPGFSYHRIDEITKLDLFGLSFSFVRTYHPVECFAVRVDKGSKSFAYTSDSVFGRELVRICENVDLAIMDCGCLEKDRSSGMLHMTPADCNRLLIESGAKKAILSHLVPYNEISDISDEARSIGDWPYEIAACDKTYIL